LHHEASIRIHQKFLGRFLFVLHIHLSQNETLVTHITT